MQVRVLFFGMLKDVAGRSSDAVSLFEGAMMGDLLDHYVRQYPKLKDFVSSIAMSVNQEYSGLDVRLKDGDEIALLPPVSGGAGNRAEIVRSAIETQSVVSRIKDAADGAVAVFEGVVRNQTRGRSTLYLDYEAYEAMALKQMESLAAEAIETFKVREVALVHRLGRVEIGETSVLIVVASAHRGAAFDACRWVIDTLKRTVPIWKKEYFEDGAVWADGEAFPDGISKAKAPIQEGLPSK